MKQSCCPASLFIYTKTCRKTEIQLEHSSVCSPYSPIVHFSRFLSLTWNKLSLIELFWFFCRPPPPPLTPPMFLGDACSISHHQTGWSGMFWIWNRWWMYNQPVRRHHLICCIFPAFETVVRTTPGQHVCWNFIKRPPTHTHTHTYTHTHVFIFKFHPQQHSNVRISSQALYLQLLRLITER